MILNRQRFIFLSGLIILAAVTRLLPHPFNFTAVGAMALFAGSSFRNSIAAFVVPLFAMLVTDSIIGFHNSMWAVYLSFGLIVLLGMTLKNRKSISGIIGRSLAGSALFFLITNFAVWLSSVIYPQSFSGLMSCYLAAIPFLENSAGSLALNTVMGDLFFNGVLFSALALAESRFPKLSQLKA